MKKLLATSEKSGIENHSVSSKKGNILRVKLGYNPNSSSIGSMIFAVPVAMLGVAVSFGAVSGIIFSSFAKKNDAADIADSETSTSPTGTEKSANTE